MSMFWVLIIYGCVIYSICGVSAAMYPSITTKNLVKRIGIGLAWPLFLAFAILKGLIWLAKRLYHDTLDLLPKQHAKEEMPKEMTVAMLSTDENSRQYQMHSWMND